MPTTDGRLRIVVGGYLGLAPAGGLAWDYLHYPLGFAALGHDVFYVEDTRLWPVYQAGGDGGDCAASVAFLGAAMEMVGLADRWAYRDEVTGRCFGMTEARTREVCRTADLLVNLSCASVLRDEHASVPTRILLDTDPMFTQIQLAEAGEGFTPGGSGIRSLVAGHTHHFTFGESVGAEGCRIPACGVDWKPTRQPIFLPEWPAVELPARAGAAFTTLMNWTAGRPLRHAGETWGQKDVEFLRFAGLPRRVPALALAVAVGQTGGAGEPFPREMAEASGWRVLDPNACAPDPGSYRSFIQASRGEVSVAKETYVKAGTGWFSGRSASYLASGRPVVAQDTGWSRHVPAGEGLFAFRTVDEAAAALETIAADPARHARAARRLAEEHFDSAVVLRRLLAAVGA
ncbi:MAG TPA: hypothetical protein VFR81_29955 [Longimicrobium sp.]|nr:hypothetical protein [Longimicrobium sp.]